MSSATRSPARRAVQRMANRAIGLATSEMPGLTVRQVARVLQYLTARGLVTTAHWSPRLVRYFGHLPDAAVWLDAVAIRMGREDAHRRPAQAAPSAPAPWAPDAPTHFPTDADGVPTWKFTLCPPSQIGLVRTNTHDDTH